MLGRKLFREIKSNFGQFFSVFILSFLAVALYTGLESNVIGGRQAIEQFHENTKLADGWLYGEGFTEDNLEQVKALDFIEGAQLRMSVVGSAPKQEGAQIDVYLQTDNEVIVPYQVKGEAYDPENTEGLWLSDTFAEAWDIRVGEDFTYEYNGVSVTKPVKGTIYTPEYEYMIAEGDVDTNFKNIGYVYMSYEAFPVREYVEHLIENGTISVETLIEETDLLDDAVEQLEEYGLTIDDLTNEMLLERVEELSDDELQEMMPYTQLLIQTNGEKDVMEYEDEIADAIDNNYAVMVDESAIIGIRRVADELTQHDAFSFVFAVVFVVVSVLVIATTMSRMVDKQRTQIGTMNALGLKRGKITFHYISYSFFVSLVGSLSGLIVGVFAIGKAMVDMFAPWYIVPGWSVGYNASYIAIVVGVVGVCTLSSYMSCKKLLRVKPSEALRPAPPKQGKSCIFEKIPFWDKLGFRTQYNLRDISRAKMRAVMGIFGTACGMMMVTWIFGCNLMLDDLYEWMFETVQNFECEMVLSDDISLEEADELREEFNGELMMMNSIEIATEPHAVSSEKSTQTLTIVEGKNLFRLTDDEMEPIEVPEGTVAITRRLAERMGIDVGDTIYWHIYTENEWYASEIGAIHRSPDSSGITMLREDYEELGCTYKPSALATNEDVSDYENDKVTSIYSIAEMRLAYEESMSILNVLVAVMAFFAVVMVVVVLYNSGNLSFNERVKEFATLKVMGFSSAKIRSLLTLQNLWLSLIGIVVGAPFAKVGLSVMVNSNGENYDWPITIPIYAYIISGIAILLTSMAVSFLFAKRIKKLDMVEILKGLE